MADERAFGKLDWTEIATFGLLAALAAYLLYHARHTVAAAQGRPYEFPAASSSNGTIEPDITLTAAPIVSVTPSFSYIGIPPIPLPGASSTGTGCGCNVTNNDQTLQQIVKIANAAQAQMQAAAYSTLQAIAAYGNDVTPLTNFNVIPG